MNIQAISAITSIFSPGTMDGVTFLPIVIPVNSQCIKIQASNGVVGDFTSFAANPPTFHFALSATPTAGQWTQHVGELNFDLVAPAGAVIGYVKAATGTVISITVGA